MRKKSTFTLGVLSSLAVTVEAEVHVTYDDGETDVLRVPQFVTGSARAGEGRVSTSQAKKDGTITDAFVNGVGLGSRGRTYVQLVIENGGRICRDYLYNNHPVVLGADVDPGPVGGHGWVNALQTADPAANAEIAAFAVPTNAMWRPLSLSVSMAQGATQTPHPALEIRMPNAVDVATVPIGADVAASTTVLCTWARGGPETRNNVNNGSMSAVMPDLLMTEGMSVNTSTEGLGANSNYGIPDLLVEEWLTGAP